MKGSRLGTSSLMAAGAFIVGVSVFVATISVAAQQAGPGEQPANPPQQQANPAQPPGAPAQPPANPAQPPANPAQPPASPAEQPASPAQQQANPAQPAASPAQPQAATAPCRVSGTVTGLGAPLPGVAITARKGYAVQSATSTSVDGAYRLSLPDGVYQLTIDLTGFERIQRDVTVSRTECAQAVDATLALAPRTPAATAAVVGRGAGPNGTPAPGQAAARGRGTGPRGFETLAVTEDADLATLAAALNASAAEALNSPSAPLQLPPGFEGRGILRCVCGHWRGGPGRSRRAERPARRHQPRRLRARR